MSQDDTDTPSDETETHEDPSFGEPTLRDTSLPEPDSDKMGPRRQGPDWARGPEDASLKGVLEALLKNQGLLMDLLSQTSILDGLERESLETREAIRRVEEDGTYVQGLVSQMTGSTEDLNQVVERLEATRRRLEDKLEPTVEALSGQVGALSQTHKSMKGVQQKMSKDASLLGRHISGLERVISTIKKTGLQVGIGHLLGLFVITLAGLVFLSPPVFNWVMDTETKIEMLPANIENKIQEYDRDVRVYHGLEPETQKMVGEAMGWSVPERNDESGGGDGESGEDAPTK
jgi:hypothetical protein